MKQSELIMGMPIIIEVVDGKQVLLEAVFNYLKQIDAQFSTYKNDSEISRYNSGALKKDELTEDMHWVLAECERYKTETNGFFDITRPDGDLDPSGLVKGWAIKGAADLIRSDGQTNFFVSAGGDVQTGGVNSAGKPWVVGIRNPSQPDKFAKTVALSGNAIATSGTYERGAHIYNPHTGKAVDGIVSLSVIGPDIYETDIFATAAFAMREPGLKFLAERGYEAMMITNRHKVITTAGFNEFVAS